MIPRESNEIVRVANPYPIWILLTLVFLVLAVISFTVTTEDAYISFRYAENLADGHGLVFNEGGEVVEGYSNPTWVFLLTILSGLGLNTIIAGRCLGLLFGSLTILELILILRLLSPARIGRGVMVAIAVLTAPYYLFWSQTGLENGLFIYLIVIGMRLALQEDIDPKRFGWSSIAYLLLALTRPEGIMYFVIIGAWKLVKLTKNNGLNDIKRLLIWSAIVIIPFIIFLIWRYVTFGDLVPNTFFAKVNNGRMWALGAGTRYLLGYFTHAFWAPILIPVVVWLARFRKPLDPTAGRLILAAAAQGIALILFVLYVGGDIHPNDRFGVPLVIFGSLIAFALIPDIAKIPWWKGIATWTILAFVILNLGYSFPPAYGITPPISRPPNFLTANISGLLAGRKTAPEIIGRFASPPIDALEYVGRDLHDNPEVNGLLAAEQCGKIPYYYDQPVIDLLGLNDRELAHIIHSVSTWDLYAEAVFEHMPGNWVMVYRNGHFISKYYIENTVLSQPFRNRWELDAIYHFDYYFIDNSGIEHRFDIELIRYVPISHDLLVPLDENEHAWLTENIPIDMNPDALSDEVEAFRLANENDPEKVINFRIDLN